MRSTDNGRGATLSSGARERNNRHTSCGCGRCSAKKPSGPGCGEYLVAYTGRVAETDDFRRALEGRTGSSVRKRAQEVDELKARVEAKPAPASD